MITNTPLLEQYEDIAADLPGSGVAWLETLRREGNDTYRSLGLPGPASRPGNIPT